MVQPVAPLPLHGQVLNDLPNPSMKKDFGQVMTEFLTTQMKNMTKLISYATGWISLGLGKEHEVGKISGEVSTFTNTMKDGLGALEIPHKAMEVRDAFKRLYNSESGKRVTAARELVLDKIPSLTNSVCDGFKFADEFVPLTAEGLRAVKGVNFGATFIGSANSAVKNIQAISDLDGPSEKNTDKTTLHLINIARDTSYVALGIIGLLSVIGLAAIAPWMFLACLTSGLTFTIGGFFYERLVVNPETKFGWKHDDVAKVHENLARALEQRNAAQAAAPAA